MSQPVQISLFNIPTFNTVVNLKEKMHKAAKECGLSRDEIVDRMNDLADRYGVKLVKGNGRGLTLDTLEKWLNPTDKVRQVPTRALPIFCAVVSSHEPLEALAQPLGVEMAGPEDQRLLKWARAYHDARRCRKIMKKHEPEI